MIGARGSALSIRQARGVIDSLQECNPSVRFRFVPVVTRGDRIKQELSCAEIGVFVKEIEAALLSREVDIAVHSLKDLPVALPAGLVLGAVTQRLDPGDVFISRDGIAFAQLPSGTKIGTGSVRRRSQICLLRKDLEPVPIRGNIDTRLRKLKEGEIEGIICAQCALWRLEVSGIKAEALPLDDFLPAPGQAALGLEIRSDDKEAAGMLADLDHQPTALCIKIERDFLSALGGGCHLPLGALAEVKGESVRVRGYLARPDGSKVIRVEKTALLAQAEGLGRLLAKEAIARGAKEILDAPRL